MRRIAKNPEVLIVQNPAIPFNFLKGCSTMKRRRKSRRKATRGHRKNRYNRSHRRVTRRKSKRTRRNRGGGSSWTRHAAKFLRAGKTLKQASAAWKRK